MLSSFGMALLGAGLALLAAPVLLRHAEAILVAGFSVHGIGMLRRDDLDRERSHGAPSWTERTLYVLYGLLLVATMIWIVWLT